MNNIWIYIYIGIFPDSTLAVSFLPGNHKTTRQNSAISLNINRSELLYLKENILDESLSQPFLVLVDAPEYVF